MKYYKQIILVLALLIFTNCGKDNPGNSITDPNLIPEQPTPTKIQLVSGNSQSDTVGTTLDKPLVVEVLDEEGDAVKDYELTFEVISGDGSIPTPNVKTDENGQAKVTVTIGSEYGDIVVHAIAAPLDNSPVIFNLKSWPVPIKEGILAEFSDEIQAMKEDFSRGVIYATLKNFGQIAVIDIESGEVMKTVEIGGAPIGLEMSYDGSELYVALNAIGSVGVIDLETLKISEIIDVSDATGNEKTYDLATISDGRIFVSASPYSFGFAYIAMIDRSSGNKVSRVASDKIIRAYPKLAIDQQENFLFIGEGFSPNHFYKLDLTKEDVPVINEFWGSGANWLAVSPDGLRLITQSGAIFSTGGLEHVASVSKGVSAYTKGGDTLFSANNNIISAYSTDDYSKIKEFETEYSSSPTSIFLREERLAVYLLSAGRISAVSLIPK